MVKKSNTEAYGIDRRTLLKSAAAASAIGFIGLPAFSGSVAASSHLGSMTIVSGTDTTVTGYRAGDEGGSFPTSSPNDPADLTWVHSSWEENLDHTFDEDARWIWHCDETSETGQTVGGEPTYYVKEPVDGDVVGLQEAFTIPGEPVSGTLHITADNGYEASINGTSLGGPHVSDSGGTAWEDSDLSDSYIDASAGTWDGVEEFDLTTHLVSGSNTLDVLAGNAQFDGTFTSNPGGVIYELHIEYAKSQEFSLCAGQDIDVGTVSVTETADGFDVVYSTTDGWTLTETHLDVGEFHTNKKGNPKIGQFDYSQTHDNVASYTYEIAFDDPQLDDVTDEACIPLAAHAVVEKVIEETPFYPSEVVSADQGLQKDGDPVADARSDPTNGLEFESGQNESNFFSLGYDGSIVVKFGVPAVNGPGTDLKVIEDTWGGDYPLETADIYVSQDGSSWSFLGTADNTDLAGIHTVSEFDLDSVGLDWIQYVKVVDTTDPALFTGTGSSGPDSDGYDLNAIEALHDSVQEETAWVCGDQDGVDRFVKRGSWATYFEFGCSE